MDLEQFYPTPPALAHKAWSLFDNGRVTRLLEPTAGRGDLLSPVTGGLYSGVCKTLIDTIEINPNNQAILLDNGYQVIANDFLTFDGGSYYSHIFLNPPFRNDVLFLLKAWDILFSGEVVAIISASSIENPSSEKARYLVKLINDHGTVEFVEDAFMDPDTQRKTKVRVALVHLTKTAVLSDDYLSNLKVEESHAGPDVQLHQDIAIRGSSIQNTVTAFNAAVRALRASVVAQEEWVHFAALVGRPLNQSDTCVQWGEVKDRQESFNETYTKLKQTAWQSVLNSSEFAAVLSSKAYKTLQTQFSQVVAREFTVENIYSLLEGLLHSLQGLKVEGLLGVFDDITKFRPENRAWYKGWKSNEKHATLAWSIKMTRFILPAPGSFYDWSDTPSHETVRLLRDFDRVFAQLEGKSKPNYGLADLFEDKEAYADLCRGKRMASEYMEVRFYPRAKTIHFFPTNKRIIEELNMQVGRHRQWLPNEGEASGRFWEQYNKAEDVTRAMKGLDLLKDWGWRDAVKDLGPSHAAACEKLNIPLNALESSQELKLVA